MPHGKAKTTPAGYRAQEIKSVPGQRYGEGIEQQAMQAAMPAADMSKTPTTVPVAAAPGAAGPPGQGPTPDLAGLMAQMPVGLLGGTQMPDQPVTAGLSSGPGGGPEMLQGITGTTAMKRMLETLSRRSGDQYFSELARKARL